MDKLERAAKRIVLCIGFSVMVVCAIFVSSWITHQLCKAWGG